LDQKLVLRTIADAFGAWKAAGNLPLTFQRVELGLSEIEISWVENLTSGTDVLAGFADYPPGTPGIANRIRLNASLAWEVSASRGDVFDLQNIVLHEIGHALGLGHSTSDLSVMSGSIGAGPGNGLFPADIEAASDIYRATPGQRVLARFLTETLDLARSPVTCPILQPPHNRLRPKRRKRAVI